MSKIKLISVLLIFLCALQVSAQKKSDYKGAVSGKEVKVNINYTFDRETKTHSFGNIAPVLMIKTKRNHFNEIELNTLGLKRFTDSYNDPWGNPVEADIREFSAGIRYQFSFRLIKKEGTLNPFIGLSALSLYSNTGNTPKVTYAYPRVTRHFNEVIAVVPHLRYNMSDRVFMNFDFPIQVMNFEYIFQEVRNPAIPIRQQRNSGIETHFEFMPVIHARLGVGVRL
jgi:hypothetical protein